MKKDLRGFILTDKLQEIGCNIFDINKLLCMTNSGGIRDFKLSGKII